jgi:polar amino acid transport system permease protein
MAIGGSSPDAEATVEEMRLREGGPPHPSERRSKMLGSDRRGLLISTISTVVFLVLVGVIVANAPGVTAVKERFFLWEDIKGAFPQVWRGFVVNLKMMFIAEAFVLVLALIIAVVRGLPGPVFFPLRTLAVIYVDVFRGIPLILVIFIIGFGLRGLGIGWVSNQSPIVYGVISLVLVYSAYVAEVYRAGIESVHPSQTAAARSLGLSNAKSLRYVIIPQAVRRVIPPLLNDFIGLQKDTALVSVIGVVEVARESQAYAGKFFSFAGYVVAAGLYLLLTIPMTRFVDYLIDRDRRKRQGGAVR